MASSLTKSFIKLTTKLNPIDIGTKYFPTTALETEYVELFNYTQTILFELKRAEITSDTILQNLIRDVGAENIPAETDSCRCYRAGSRKVQPDSDGSDNIFPLRRICPCHTHSWPDPRG